MAIEDDDLLVETTVVEPTEVSRPGVRRTHVSSLRSPVLGGRYQITTRPTSSRFPLSADRDVTHVRDATIEADDPPPSSARRRLADGSSSGLYRIWAPADAGGAREVSIRRARPPSEDEVSAITDFLSRNKRR
ncbi:MAG TPA: hypothetical protein VMZ28_13190 [Kofleriaceae bacterium]|nr:hypothetical protein [Kofleriaceae bacterium]